MRTLADPTRLRIVALLHANELSVNELQEITRLGQSRISTHLGLLEEGGVVAHRREGKRTFYKLLAVENGQKAVDVALSAARELPEHAADELNCKRILARR